MHVRNDDLGVIDWGSLATTFVSEGVKYKAGSLLEKRAEANRRAAAADAAAARARDDSMFAPVGRAVAPVARGAASVVGKITSSPVIMIGAAGALGLALFLMKRKK